MNTEIRVVSTTAVVGTGGKGTSWTYFEVIRNCFPPNLCAPRLSMNSGSREVGKVGVATQRGQIPDLP